MAACAMMAAFVALSVGGSFEVVRVGMVCIATFACCRQHTPYQRVATCTSVDPIRHPRHQAAGWRMHAGGLQSHPV